MSDGAVKHGYKQTEAGVIPEDWRTFPCSALSTFITVGIVVRPAQYYVAQGVPALRSANVREDGITDTDMVFISEKANALLSKSQVREGDVLTVRTGYPGTSAVVPPRLSGANCIDILITRPSRQQLSSDYFAAWINSSFGKDQVLRNQGGLAQKHFNVGDLRSLVVALPPTKAEQEAIAEALSDADALIESLQQLLAKKRHLKQGAMQELLTGQKRLPGFGSSSGYKQSEIGALAADWHVSALKTLATMKSGESITSAAIDDFASYPCYGGNGLRGYPPAGGVRIAAPTRMSEAAIRVLAISKLGWIKQQRKAFQAQERETARAYVSGESHYLWGKRYLLTIEEHPQPPAIEIKHSRLILRVRPDTATAKRQVLMDDWYRQQLKQAVPSLLAKWESRLGVKAARFVARRMRTKWGSCNAAAGSISLNSDLAKKPPECLEYIVVHELAHLVEPTHNARFVAVMDRAMPHWQHHRRQLNRLPVRHEDWRC